VKPFSRKRRQEEARQEARDQLALGLLVNAQARAEPAVPEPPQPETQSERVLCYSPNGAFAHDDIGGVVPRPACHGGAKRYTRAVSPSQKKRAAALRPCPHCARLRESGETSAAS
jgi:hypothetical protein